MNPVDATDRGGERIGKDGMERLFRMSVALQGKAALEDSIHVDTTVQEKNITYPTDGKLAIKIINRLNKLARAYGIRQRRTYAKEAKTQAPSSPSQDAAPVSDPHSSHHGGGKQ